MATVGTERELMSEDDIVVSGEAKKAIVGSSLGSALEWVDFTA